MDEQQMPHISPEVARAFILGVSERGRRIAQETAEYEKLLVFADQCNISRAAVDAKLITASVRETFDWIASGEAVPLPSMPKSQQALRHGEITA